MNRKDLFLISICVCLIGVLGYSLIGFLSSYRFGDDQRSALAFSTLEHSLSLESLTVAMADVESSTMESGVSFLAGEAGICAYGNVGQEINLTKVKEAFRGIEYECEDYIIGSVPIPGYPESEDVHMYVHRTGWMASYYTKTEYVAKIIKDFMKPEDNKIEDAITVICSTLWIGKPELRYYDFRYPDANTLMMVGDEHYGSGSNTFRIFVPSEIESNISRFEYYYWGEGGESNFGMHGQTIQSSKATGYGTITLVPKDKPDELMKPTELKLDTLTTVWVTGGYNSYTGNRYHAHGGFIILLRYD